MECNKEEAIRAKDMAEMKMETKDFVGAKKLLLKAQRLFSELDNISQLLTVCEVHCCAIAKVNDEMDWYGILQVDLTADESSIKKQYRKLALLLHPDKNKFSGAESAFKLIGEAQRTLSEPSKRSIYDMKRKGNIRNMSARPPPKPSYKPPDSWKQGWDTGNGIGTAAAHSNGINNLYHHQQQKPSCSTAQTFWTNCPSCSMKYQYYCSLLNKNLRCQKCLVTFIASDMNSQGPIPGANPVTLAQPTNLRSGTGTVQGGGCTYKMKDARVNEEWEAGTKAKKPEEAKVKEASKSGHAKGNTGRKRGRNVVESSNSDSDSTDSEDINSVNPDINVTGNHNPRRSTRQKRNVAYNEDRIEDDGDHDDGDHDNFASAPSLKRLRKGASSSLQTEPEDLPNGNQPVTEENKHKPIGEEKGKAKVEAGLSGHSDLNSSFSFPDPEFFDFDKERNVSRISTDEIWACYDNLDGMPRFYARIRSVSLTDCKVKFTWLEHSPKGEAEHAWSQEELPVACGNYQHGRSETSQLHMFSHRMSFKPGARRNFYDIYPIKGEVWALFKGWDISWSLDSDAHKDYEYEVIEVISDLSEGDEIVAVHLVRVEGFVCLFMGPKDEKTVSISIPMGEMLRFSHRIPSYRLTGDERKGVPIGSFELDCASLPANFTKAFPAVHLGDESIGSSTNKKDFFSSDINKTPQYQNDRSAETSKANGNGAVKDEDPEAIEYPDPEFYDFRANRSMEVLQCGQIWALYSDIDQYPNYYAEIKQVKVDDDTVIFEWLESCNSRKSKQGMPVSCGTFKMSYSGKVTYDSTEAFSHLVKANPSKRRAHYEIWPNVGEVWAIFKNWKNTWEPKDLEDCEYEIVKINERTGSMVVCMLLRKVNGHRSVFMPETRGDMATIEIPIDECLRFSHQIPAFGLSEERGGKLRGYFELDPASVPAVFLFTETI